jgi:hypothetical protein
MANIVEKKERAEGLGVGRHLPSHPTVATDGVTTSSCRGSWRLWLAPGGGEDGWGGGVRQGRGWGARAAFIAEAGLMVDTVHMAWRGDHVGRARARLLWRSTGLGSKHLGEREARTSPWRGIGGWSAPVAADQYGGGHRLACSGRGAGGIGARGKSISRLQESRERPET